MNTGVAVCKLTADTATVRPKTIPRATAPWWWQGEEVNADDPVETYEHTSVLLREVADALLRSPEGLYIDVTLGGGGHSAALLTEATGARVIGFDRDPAALAAAQRRLAPWGERFVCGKATFSELGAALTERDVNTVDGIVADLGVSSPQLNQPARGLSFRTEGPLDMRMDPTSGVTAAELVADLSCDELADVLYQYGEERRSRRIARCIKRASELGELTTTLDLRRAVVRAVGPARVGGIDPATRTFQALRIAVNGELDELTALITTAAERLTSGGVLAVISFHSLEDRIVKRALQNRAVWAPLTKKPVTPTEEEIAANPRARSAKLRAAVRMDPIESS